ncbi:MAG TPA: hypothetical protein V6D50_00335 [Chroococcales cyanobacterium]
MNIRHLSLQIGLGIVLTIGSVISGNPVQAQIGNQSDTTGAIVTTSDITGGAFAPSGGGRRTIVFRTNQIKNSVYSAAGTLNQQLAARVLPIVATGPQAAIPATVQQNLECVLTGGANTGNCIDQMVSALVNAGADPTLARNLVSSLRGLTDSGRVDAAQFDAVVRAYNAFINSSNAAILSNPPGELRGIQSILSILLNAAYARS